MTEDNSIRLLLVDDHQLLLDTLKDTINQADDMELIAQAKNGRDAVFLAEKLEPDVIILDVSMPELNGIEASRQIIKNRPGQKILALSMHSDKHYVIGMLKAGVCGYVLKTNAFEELALAIRQVASGKFYVSAEITGIVVDMAVGREPGNLYFEQDNLSSREIEVLQLIAEGKNTTVIADKLSISKRTVEIHRRNLKRKLGLETTAELTIYAVKNGIISL